MRTFKCPYHVLLVASLMLLGQLFSCVSASSCTESCDAQYATDDSLPVTICGTDLTTHSMHRTALKSCYMNTCEVQTYYEGSCGCPNDCFVQLGQGKCALDGVCSCTAGWTGKDCSQPTYGNSCNLHGKLITVGSKDSLLPFDYCQCDEGFTGIDCSTATFTGGAAPWDSLVDAPKPFTSEDKYGDDHPVWNVSVLANIHVTIDDNLFLGLLQPWNSDNDTYVQAAVHFHNGYVTESYAEVGMKIKGSMCRKEQKKCYNLKFNEFVDGQKLKGIKKLGLKSGTSNDDILLRNLLFSNFNRAMVVPVQRGSYGNLYVNGVYYGVYFMHEDVDADFIARRIENDDGSGNLMKFNSNSYMHYLGPDVATYQALGTCEQASGDGNWTDYVSFVQFLNTTSTTASIATKTSLRSPAANNDDQQFESDLPHHLDVDTFLRMLPVESFMLDSDGMTANGKNYYLYHLLDRVCAASERNRWLAVKFDFDFCLEFDETGDFHFDTEMSTDIFDYFLRAVDSSDYNPLTNRMLTDSSFTSTYLKNYQLFLDGVFGSASKQQPSVRYGELMQLLVPWVARDYLWTVSHGGTKESFVYSAEKTMLMLNQRYQNVTKQIDMYSKQLK